MRLAAILILALSLTGATHGGPDSFPYVTWTNTAGSSFEARFDHIDDDKVVLRAKQGGKRYPVKRDTLSDASENLLGSYQAETTKKLQALEKNPGAPIPVELAYRAVALGVAGKLTALRYRTINFTINKIRVKDRLTAILELDGDCFRILKAPGDREFFLKNDALYTRPAQKDNRFPYPKRTNANARLVHERAGSLPLRVEPGLGVSWQRIGVTDGPVFR